MFPKRTRRPMTIVIRPDDKTWQFELIDCVPSELRGTEREYVCFLERSESEKRFTFKEYDFNYLSLRKGGS